MSYSNSFPTQRPSLNLDFANSGKLDSRISYSRSSSGTYLSSEKALNSENLLLQSQDFDTSWTASGIAAPTGSQTAPDGTATAWLLTCNSGTATGPRILQSYTVSANTEYTMVAHLKAGTASHGYAVFRSDGTYQYAAAMLDFSAGTISVTSAGMTSASGTVTALGSNWFRITVTATTSTSVSSPFAQVGISDGTAIGLYARPSWNPVGTETMYAWGIQLSSTNSKVYDSPTTTQISRSYSQLLKTASADSPRFEYDASGNSEGLLIESQATSLVTYSEDFSHAFWDKTRLSIDSNVAVAPDGALTASAMRVDGTAAASHRMRFSYATGGATPQTFSIFAKAGSKSHVALKFDSSGGAFDASIAYFNLASGTTGTVDSGVTATINDCGNGWYRCSVTRTALASATGQIELYVAEADNDVSIDGNSYDHILCWGAQVEANTSAPSSYIKSNSGSSTTKSADSCSVVDATLFSSGEHTIIWEGDTDKCGDDPNVDKRFFSLSDTTTSNRLAVDYNDGTQVRLRNWADGNNDVAITYNADLTSGTHKVAATLKTNEAQLVVDGTRRQVDTSCVVGTGIQRLGVNTAFADAYQQYNMNGHCKRLTYYNVALSQTEVEALTSNP